MCCQTDTMTNLVVCALLVAVTLIEPPPAFADNCPYAVPLSLTADSFDACKNLGNWFRIQVNNIDVDLPSSEPPDGSCSTNSSLYLKDPVNKVDAGISYVESCFSNGAECVPGPAIGVSHCGGYRAYYFGGTFPCPAIVCLDIDECEDNTTCGLNAVCVNSPGSYTCTCAEGFELDMYANACTALFPVDVIRPVVCLRGGTSSKEGYYKKLRFECRFDPPGANYFYDVVWIINGNEVTRLTKLRGSDLPRAGQLRLSKTVYKTGINVQCAVRIRAAEDVFPSPEHKSDEFFFQPGAGLSYKEWVKRGCG